MSMEENKVEDVESWLFYQLPTNDEQRAALTSFRRKGAHMETLIYPLGEIVSS